MVRFQQSISRHGYPQFTTQPPPLSHNTLLHRRIRRPTEILVGAIDADGFGLRARGGDLDRAAIEGEIALHLDAAGLGLVGRVGQVGGGGDGHFDAGRGGRLLLDEEVAVAAQPLRTVAGDRGAERAAREGAVALALDALDIGGRHREVERAAVDEDLAVEFVVGRRAVVAEGAFYIDAVAGSVGGHDGAAIHAEILANVEAIARGLFDGETAEALAQPGVFVAGIGVARAAAEAERSPTLPLGVALDEEGGAQGIVGSVGQAIDRAIGQNHVDAFAIVDPQGGQGASGGDVDPIEHDGTLIATANHDAAHRGAAEVVGHLVLQRGAGHDFDAVVGLGHAEVRSQGAVGRDDGSAAGIERDVDAVGFVGRGVDGDVDGVGRDFVAIHRQAVGRDDVHRALGERGDVVAIGHGGGGDAHRLRHGRGGASAEQGGQ